MVLAAAEAETLEHFAFEPERLDTVASYVADTIKAAYPTLAVPYHSRWRHFAAGGVERWQDAATRLTGRSRAEVARSRIDLAVASVLLDAGAGERWRYREGERQALLARSEGLAVASFRLFLAGAFSARAREPLRCDAAALVALDDDVVAAGFQVSRENPLPGFSARVALLRRVGTALAERPDLFGAEAPRIGNLFDYFAAQSRDGAVPLPMILATLLDGFATIWPSRLSLAGHPLGDVWRHPAARSADLTDGLVPFHKLSQWLSYSLVEPLEEAGLRVTELDALTGLPEYRNGGLLVDLGALRPKHAGVLARPHPVDSELVVEWRALTVALLDRVAERVRASLGVDAAGFPLAKVLEGGTWSAGRRIARERRPDGAPPILVASDGTVF